MQPIKLISAVKNYDVYIIYCL